MWNFGFDDGTTACIDDMPADVLVGICQKHGQDWLTTYYFPATDPGAFYEVFSALAAQFAKDPPARPHTAGELARLVARMTKVKDPPSQAGGRTRKRSSTGTPAGTDGPQP